jgi:hypothetical protein
MRSLSFLCVVIIDLHRLPPRAHTPFDGNHESTTFDISR